MTTVYKYPVPIQDSFTLRLPQDADVLTVQQQGAGAVLWAELETDDALVDRRFNLIGTGHSMPVLTNDEWRDYVGTFQLGGCVFHLFEVNSR